MILATWVGNGLTSTSDLWKQHSTDFGSKSPLTYIQNVPFRISLHHFKKKTALSIFSRIYDFEASTINTMRAHTKPAPFPLSSLIILSFASLLAETRALSSAAQTATLATPKTVVEHGGQHLPFRTISASVAELHTSHATVTLTTDTPATTFTTLIEQLSNRLSPTMLPPMLNFSAQHQGHPSSVYRDAQYSVRHRLSKPMRRDGCLPDDDLCLPDTYDCTDCISRCGPGSGIKLCVDDQNYCSGECDLWCPNDVCSEEYNVIHGLIAQCLGDHDVACPDESQ